MRLTTAAAATTLLSALAMSGVGTAAAQTSDNTQVCGIAPPQAVNARADGAGRHAVLIGVDDYADPAVPDLHGARNDLCGWRRLLISHLGFHDREIEMVLGPAASRAGVAEALGPRLAGRVAAGDVVFVAYSGHGSQVIDESGDETGADGLDETIVPYDGDRLGGRHIRDEELGAWIGDVVDAGADVTVFIDACHSGSGLRSAGSVRGFGPGFGGGAAQRGGGEGGEPALDLTIGGGGTGRLTVMSAARASQLATEAVRGSRAYGAFSLAVSDTIEQAGAGLTPRLLVERARVRLQSMGVDDQDPVLEGRGGDAGFLGGRSGAGARLIASPDPAGGLRIATGEIAGETVGSSYLLTPFDRPDAPARAARVVDVAAFEARLAVDDGRPAVGDFVARKTSHSYTFDAPSVFVTAAAVDAGAVALADAIAQAPSLGAQVVNETWRARYLVTVLSGDRARIWSASGADLGEADSAAGVARRLDDLEWVRRVRALRNPAPGPELDIALTGPACDDAAPGATSRAVCLRVSGPPAELSYRNPTGRRLTLNLITVNADGTIDAAIVGQDVEPGASTTTLLHGDAPSGEREVSLLKFFVSDTYVSLDTLARRTRGCAISDDRADALNALLCAAGSQRSGAVDTGGGWSVVDVSVTVDP